MVTQDLWPQKYPKNSLTVKPAQRSWSAQLNLTAEEHSKSRRCVKPGPWFTALQGIRDSCDLTLHKLFESISSSTRIVMTDNGPSTNKQTDRQFKRTEVTTRKNCLMPFLYFLWPKISHSLSAPVSWFNGRRKYFCLPGIFPRWNSKGHQGGVVCFQQ